MLFEAITNSKCQTLLNFYKIRIKTKQLLGMYVVKCAMWYIIIVTAFTSFLLDATTGLLRGVLLHILLSFTLIFHLWFIMIGGNRGVPNFKKLCSFITSYFLLLCVHIHNQQKLCL